MEGVNGPVGLWRSGKRLLQHQFCLDGFLKAFLSIKLASSPIRISASSYVIDSDFQAEFAALGVVFAAFLAAFYGPLGHLLALRRTLECCLAQFRPKNTVFKHQIGLQPN